MEITSKNEGASDAPDEGRLMEENHELHFVAEDKVDSFTWTVEEEKAVVERAFEILKANRNL